MSPSAPVDLDTAFAALWLYGHMTVLVDTGALGVTVPVLEAELDPAAFVAVTEQVY